VYGDVSTVVKHWKSHHLWHHGAGGSGEWSWSGRGLKCHNLVLFVDKKAVNVINNVKVNIKWLLIRWRCFSVRGKKS